MKKLKALLLKIIAFGILYGMAILVTYVMWENIIEILVISAILVWEIYEFAAKPLAEGRKYG